MSSNGGHLIISGLPPAISLRQVSREDESFLFDLYCQTRTEEIRDWGWDDQQRQVFLRMQFAAQSAHYRGYPGLHHLIILSTERPVGRICLSEREDEILLVDISLVADSRRQGIGGALIGCLCHSAGSSGRSVSLHVTVTNPAINLYRRLGFNLVDNQTADNNLYLPMRWHPTGVEA